MDPFLAEIRLFPFDYAPRGWAQCKGQLLPVAQNTALFSLLGTTYGGDGKTTFGLPNLCGRAPLHVGSSNPWGQAAGQETHTLLPNEIPIHTHMISASNAAGSTPTAAGSVWSNSGPINVYANTATGVMSVNALASTGGGQPHTNMQPFLVLNICIATQGVWPSRS